MQEHEDPFQAVDAIAEHDMLGDLLVEREQTILKQMISRYRNGKLDAPALYGLVGQLSEIASIEERSQRKVAMAIVRAEEAVNG